MYHRALAGRVGLVGKTVARRHGLVTDGACLHLPLGRMIPGAAAASPGCRRTQQQQQRPQQQVCGLSSQATQSDEAGGGEGEGDGGEKGRKVRRTAEETQKVAAHKAAMQEYKLKMTVLRKEILQETKEKKLADAVSAAVERRLISKRQDAAFAERRRKAAISIALNDKKQAKQKANYEAGFREAARIFYEREERKKNIHAILLEELEEESKSWLTTPEDVTAKITDDLWDIPGNNSAGAKITMPDEHLWRFSADIGLYNQEQEPSERNTYLRSRMYSRMEEMHTADTYVRERRTRWDNDTRGLLKEADRLVRKTRPAPPGYLQRLENTRPENDWKAADEDKQTARRERKAERHAYEESGRDRA